MTEQEITLINLIRNHPNPEEAYEKALDIILEVLMQPEPCE